MKLTRDNPPSVAAPFGSRFSHVARLDFTGGALLMLSGQVAVDGSGAVVGPGDVGAQSECIFELIGAILATHDATFDDVLHIRTFMTDLDDLPRYGEVRRKYVTAWPPVASTTVEVSRLFLPEALLEVEVTAAVARTG